MKIFLPLVLCLCLASARALDLDALRSHYEKAVEAARTSYETQVDGLLLRYGQHLERLAAAAQARGDLEEVLALRAEREASQARRGPGTGESDATLAALRRTLAEHLAQQGQGLTNEWIRIEATYADALRGQADGRDDAAATLAESEARLGALRGEPVAQTAAVPVAPPALELGENILSHGDFDKAGANTWRVELTSHYRNGTGLFTEPLGDTGGVRNRTMRLDRDRAAVVSVTRGIQIPKDVTELSLTWRARLLKPEREDVAVSGTGSYIVGVGTTLQRWNALTEAQRAKAVYTSRTQQAPPSGVAWQRHSAILKVDAHINYAYIRVPPGKGEWLVDDLELRPVKPKPEAAKPPPPR